ncbi:MAG: hypothetical protein M3076_00785 [Actinomycetota bacterium]|nr:hypothetical protein [Actinomycetota bacterium]
MLPTIAALADFEADDRERGLDLLQDAEGVFVEISAPSRLATTLLSVGLTGMGIEETDPPYGAYAGAALLGYACRLGQDSPPRPPNDAARVERHLVRIRDGELDYERMSEEPDRLRGLVAYLAELDERGFFRLLGNSPEAWAVFSIGATMQLQRNLLRNGLPRRKLPDSQTLRALLRLGYPVRFVDEVAGEAPTPLLTSERGA